MFVKTAYVYKLTIDAVAARVYCKNNFLMTAVSFTKTNYSLTSFHNTHYNYSHLLQIKP